MNIYPDFFSSQSHQSKYFHPTLDLSHMLMISLSETSMTLMLNI